MFKSKSKSARFCIFGAFFASALFFYCSFIFLSFYFTLDSQTDIFENTYSKSVLDRNEELLSVFLDKSQQWHLKSPKPVPQKLKTAVLMYEDKRFEKHFGVDFLALFRSFKNNINSKKQTGASTISMQVVKLALNKPKRTYFVKFKEIFQALALESVYPKEQILQMYLNNAPYGGNIIGYTAAARLYFDKDSENLSWAECALLAVLPNAPGLINIQKNAHILKAKRDKLLHRLHENNHFDETILKLALSEPIPQGKKYHKNIAPHLSLKLASKAKSGNVQSTININFQVRLENKIKQYHQKLQSQGILNLAALVLDTQSGEILSYIGSQDFLDIENFGQIDGVAAVRSPGSLLKPFLYALSIDNGLLTPQSLLVDVPMYFSNFNPKNATKTYQGLVSAQNALQQSLNVPFVKLLTEFGYQKFFYALQEMANLPPSDPDTYGLSLILGSKEMSMLQIARLYRGLGKFGEFGGIYALKDEPKQKYVRYISKGSAYLTLQTLKELKREAELEYHKDKMAFSWKSGTSYGRKDAWAAGVSPKYTIVVWAGNFTGASNPNIFGVKTAGSLLFELLEELPDNNVNFALPDDALKLIEVDRLSGYRVSYDDRELFIQSKISNFENLDSENLQAKISQVFQSVLYPIDAQPLRVWEFYEKVFMANGKQVDSMDENFINAKPKIVLKLPLSVLSFYKMHNVDIQKHLNTKRKSIDIIYPTNDLRIIQPRDLNTQRELIMRIANIKAQNVAWYLDGKLIFSSSDETFKMLLNKGEHSLSLVADDGSTQSVRFFIE